MIDTETIMDTLRTILDPEMPISIVDLGLVAHVRIEPNGDRENVSIDILPTFVGCPALEMIENEIKAKVSRLAGVSEVTVTFRFDPPWSVDRISAAGRESLRAHGVTVPEHGSTLDVPGHGAVTTVQLRTSAIACPFCGSDQTHVDSPFGPTRCRMIFYCDSCRNSFEHLKRI